jgi:hypothetical protein
MQEVEVRLKNGSTTRFPIPNLDNFKRLMGHEIASIKPVRNESDIVDEEVEIISTTSNKSRRKVNQ